MALTANSTLITAHHPFDHYDHPTPVYVLEKEGEDITHNFKDKLIQLTLTEERSDTADQLDITIDDKDNNLSIPKKGARLSLSLGYLNKPLVFKGVFIVDETEYSFSPRQLTIRARSAEFTGALRQNREQSWHKKTIEEIVKIIAGRNQLKYRIATELAQKVIDHIDQTGESDIAFLSRLGRMYDAVATIKNESLIFLSISNTVTSKGETLPSVQLKISDLSGGNITEADRESYTGVRAYYSDKDAATRKSTLAGEDKDVKELTDLYENEKAAKEAAQSAWQEIQRSVTSMSINISKGRPDFMPQTPVKVSGIKPEYDGIQWLATRVTHTLTNGGLTTSLELEQLDHEK